MQTPSAASKRPGPVSRRGQGQQSATRWGPVPPHLSPPRFSGRGDAPPPAPRRALGPRGGRGGGGRVEGLPPARGRPRSSVPAAAAGDEGAAGACDVRGGQVQHPATRHQEPGGAGLGAERPAAQVSGGRGEAAGVCFPGSGGSGAPRCATASRGRAAAAAGAPLPLPGGAGPAAWEAGGQARGAVASPRLSGGAPRGSLLLRRREAKGRVRASPHLPGGAPCPPPRGQGRPGEGSGAAPLLTARAGAPRGTGSLSGFPPSLRSGGPAGEGCPPPRAPFAGCAAARAGPHGSPGLRRRGGGGKPGCISSVRVLNSHLRGAGG